MAGMLASSTQALGDDQQSKSSFSLLEEYFPSPLPSRNPLISSIVKMNFCFFIAWTGWSETICWKKENYPHLHMPLSPCITLQWTIRDGRLVNLPWALLVEGDTILLRPGQEVPGHCSQLKVSCVFQAVYTCTMMILTSELLDNCTLKKMNCSIFLSGESS